jgi:hypothetical protein
VAAALATSGLNAACKATSSAVSAVTSSAASSAVSSITSQLAGFGIDSVLNAVGGWVTAGASWLVTQIGAVIANSTTVDLGASWFVSNYETMMALAGVVIVPMLLLGIMQAVYRQNGTMLIRSVLVNVPLALLLTAVAIKLVSLGLAVTDAMSSAVSQGAGLDAGRFLSSVSLGLTGSGTAQPSVPTFVLFIAGMVVVFGALMVWVELLIRSAAIYVAVLFLPLVLASLAWPAIAHWCRRLVDTLVALILGKFVIVAVLSLAAGALAGGLAGGAGTTTDGVGGSAGGAAAGGSGSGAGGSTGSGGGGFAAVLGGAALLLLAAFAPWALFRLLPFIEAGAVSHLEGLSHRARQTAALPVRGLANVAMRSSGAGASFGARGGAAGALIGSTAGSLGAGGSGGGPGGGSGGGPGDGPGGDGPPGTRPDSEPSSVERTGVGTLDSPGHGIPAWAVHPEATAAARRHFGDLSNPEVNSGPDAGPAPGEQAQFLSAAPVGASLPAPSVSSFDAAAGSSPDDLVVDDWFSAGIQTTGAGPSIDGPRFPDPATTPTLPPDTIGHDELGVRLIPAPRSRGPLPVPAAPSPGPVPTTPAGDPPADGGR